MATETECLCCHEFEVYRAKFTEGANVNCITLHPGFAAGCLNEWALQIAYFAYRQQHGPAVGNINEYVKS
jgi:hypothetical protein